MLLNVKAKVAAFGERIEVTRKFDKFWQFVLIIVEHLLAKISDAFWCALNAQASFRAAVTWQVCWPILK